MSTAKRRGRPRSSHKKIFITVPLPERTYRKLDAYAREQNLYKGQILASLIDAANLTVGHAFEIVDPDDVPARQAYAAAG